MILRWVAPWPGELDLGGHLLLQELLLLRVGADAPEAEDRPEEHRRRPPGEGNGGRVGSYDAGGSRAAEGSGVPSGGWPMGLSTPPPGFRGGST